MIPAAWRGALSPPGLVGILLLAASGCSSSESPSYPSLDALPEMPPGVHIVDTSKLPRRDCEGPYCTLHVALADSGSGLADLVAVMRSQGWSPQPAAYPGQVALCKNPGGLFVSLATKRDEVKAFPRTLASWPALDRGDLALTLQGGRKLRCQ